MRRLATSIFLALAALSVTAVSGEAKTKRADPAFLKQQFSGWTGLAFYCNLNPVDETTKAVCEWTAQRLRTLALPARIPVQIISGPGLEAYQQISASANKAPLFVELEIFGLEPSAGLVANYISLRAGNYYAAGTETLYPNAAEAIARGGTFVLWRREFLTAGGARGPQNEANLRQNIETMLLRFVSDFGEGNASP